jgi:hypothetical protein
MTNFELLNNIFTEEQLFFISATAIPEIDINFSEETITFNTTKTYNRDEISNFLASSNNSLQEYKNSFGSEPMDETTRNNITWITDQLRKLEVYLNT